MQRIKFIEANVSLFQSAPAIAGGRCRNLGTNLAALEHVSIRARHCWRAMPSFDN